MKGRRQHAGDERRRQTHGHDTPPCLVRAQSGPLDVDFAKPRRRSATHGEMGVKALRYPLDLCSSWQLSCALFEQTASSVLPWIQTVSRESKRFKIGNV